MPRRKIGSGLVLAGGMRRRRMRGGRFDGHRIRNFFSGINNWLKKSQIVSKLGNIYGSTGLPFAANVSNATKAAHEQLGWGRRRIMRYGSIRRRK